MAKILTELVAKKQIYASFEFLHLFSLLKTPD